MLTTTLLHTHIIDQLLCANIQPMIKHACYIYVPSHLYTVCQKAVRQDSCTIECDILYCICGMSSGHYIEQYRNSYEILRSQVAQTWANTGVCSASCAHALGSMFVC